jgi:hypothetical protein
VEQAFSPAGSAGELVEQRSQIPQKYFSPVFHEFGPKTGPCPNRIFRPHCYDSIESQGVSIDRPGR